MIYLVGWAFSYLTILLSTFTRYRSKPFFITAILLFAAISIFRGDVGTDTANYERILLSYANLEEWQGGELGFIAAGWILINILGSAEFSVRFISLIFFFLLIIFLARADKNEIYLLTLYITPAFSYQYSMNALRIGMASSILLIAIQEFRKRNKISTIALLLTTFFFIIQ